MDPRIKLPATVMLPNRAVSVQVSQVQGRAEAAEAELRECRDSFTEVERVAMRVVAAEARCARLQQALDHLLSDAQHHNLWWLENRIREALAGPDTPADSQEDKT